MGRGWGERGTGARERMRVYIEREGGGRVGNYEGWREVKGGGTRMDVLCRGVL